jgi:hypothetical protein
MIKKYKKYIKENFNPDMDYEEEPEEEGMDIIIYEPIGNNGFYLLQEDMGNNYKILYKDFAHYVNGRMATPEEIEEYIYSNKYKLNIYDRGRFHGYYWGDLPQHIKQLI